MLQHSIVHRLPQRFRWDSEFRKAVIAEEGIGSDQDLIALRLISHDGLSARDILCQLRDVLAAIQVESKVAEYAGTPCLVIRPGDESAANCCLKNQGVAIAENFRG